MRQLIVGYNGAGDAGHLVMDAAISVVQGGQCHDDVAVIIVARMPEEDFFAVVDAAAVGVRRRQIGRARVKKGTHFCRVDCSFEESEFCHGE